MEKDNNNYIWLYHRYRNIKTIKDFMDREHIYSITPEEFFELNRELIWSQYGYWDKYILHAGQKAIGNDKWPESAADLDINAWLPCPCNLRIQATKVEERLAISQTNFQTQSGDFYAFAAEEIANILQNEGYQISSAEKKAPTVQVFGWFKSLYYVGLSALDNSKITGSKEFTEFADLSKHIISLSTMVGKDGGSFTMRLPIINASGLVAVISKNNKERDYVGQRGRASKDRYSNSSFYRYDDQYYSKDEYNILEANYYNWLISSNDLLFISFEKLDMETKRSTDHMLTGDEDNFDIQTNIAAQVYDMIALVDDVKVVHDAQSATAYVEVTGRDFMKLLIEDGSFFFNPSTTSNPSEVFANEQSYGKQGDIKEADQINNTYNNPIGRLRRVTGEIDIFSNRINMDLGYILKGVISQLANVEVVPGYVFDSWGDLRTTFNELQPVKKEK